LKDVFVQSEVGYELLELAVLFFELAKATEFSYTHTGELLPSIEGLFSDAELAADFEDWCACFDLAESLGYLLFGELGLLHRDLLSRGPRF
jgi:hypothetical protein